MKKKIFTEDFQNLSEFIQKINNIITPFSFRDELKAVMNKETRKHLSEKYPKCFLPVRIGNKDAFIIPICNRNGATDKNMISFSIKLANKLLDREDVDRGMLEIVIKKLNRMYNTYSKDIPTPPDMAARKANVTKAMILLKKQLNALRSTDKDGEPVVQRAPIAVP
jgi:hypothetical protein